MQCGHVLLLLLGLLQDRFPSGWARVLRGGSWLQHAMTLQARFNRLLRLEGLRNGLNHCMWAVSEAFRCPFARTLPEVDSPLDSACLKQGEVLQAGRKVRLSTCSLMKAGDQNLTIHTMLLTKMKAQYHPWRPCQEPTPCWWELNKPTELSNKWKLSKVRCVSPNMHSFCVWLARSQILEQVLPLGSVQCSPHTLLVDLPCNVEECWSARAHPRRESKDKSPTVMFGIPHQLVLVEVRLEHHHLQYTTHVLHGGHTGGVSIRDLLLRFQP